MSGLSYREYKAYKLCILSVFQAQLMLTFKGKGFSYLPFVNKKEGGL